MALLRHLALEHEYEGADYDDYNVRSFGDDAQGGREAYFPLRIGRRPSVRVQQRAPARAGVGAAGS